MNTERASVVEFLRGGGRPVAIDSPLACALAGSILELDVERGTSVLAFVPEQRFVQGTQVLQGGIVTAMLDFAMAFAAHVLLTDRQPFATASLNVNLLRPALPGRHIARGRIVRRGRKLLFAEAELAVADGKLVATASSVLALLEP